MAEIPAGLKAARRAVEQELLKKPGVVGVGIGYKEVGGQQTDTLSIRVFVEQKRDVPDEERIPPTVEDYPTDVLESRYELHDRVVSDEDMVPLDRPRRGAEEKKYDPVVGGISIGPQRLVGGVASVGTLGAVVEDSETHEPLLLSCFHVLAVDRSGAEGDAIVQPGRPDGGAGDRYVVGKLVRSALGEGVDAAVASTNRAARGEIIGIGPVQGAGTAEIGQTVRKQGRSSGLRYGVVDTVELSVQIRYGGGIGLITSMTRSTSSRTPTATRRSGTGATPVRPSSRTTAGSSVCTSPATPPMAMGWPAPSPRSCRR
jgi:hypothetical protein